MDYEPIDEYDHSPATKGDLKNLEKRFTALEQKFDKLYNLVDGFAGEVKTYNEERTSETYQISLIRDWAKKVGEKIGIPIEL